MGANDRGKQRAQAPGGEPGSAARRDRIAAQRLAAQRVQRRNRLLIAGGAIVAIVAIVVAFVALRGSSSPGRSGGAVAGTPPTGQALAQAVATTTSVPAATLDKVGAGQATGHPTPITGTPLTSGGKPEILYMGAEFCPYCAAERWAMVVALSRFGTFSGLSATHSAAKDGSGQPEPFPNTATWTFVNSAYTSKYLTFTPVEMNTNIPDPATGGYTTLQTPTAGQLALANTYNPGGTIPFIDFGNRYLIVGASYDAGVLAGLSWSQIASDLHNPASPVAKSVLGTANYMTAAICSLTGDQPASACTPVVKSLQSQLR